MISIVDYGVGNLFSLSSSLKSIGADTIVTSDKQKILDSSAIILPGVGAFSDAKEKLVQSGLFDVVINEANKGNKLLGIIACLYFGRNREMIPIKVSEEINRNYDKYGFGGRQAFRVKDGFCFTRSTVEGTMDEVDANNDRVDSHPQ